VNKVLKERWFDIGDEDRKEWKKWEFWDNLRYERDKVIRADVLEDDLTENGSSKDEAKRKVDNGKTLRIPRKKRDKSL